MLSLKGKSDAAALLLHLVDNQDPLLLPLATAACLQPSRLLCTFDDPLRIVLLKVAYCAQVVKRVHYRQGRQAPDLAAQG